MHASSGTLPGVVVFTPSPHHDERGFFTRTFDSHVARSAGVDPDAFVQDSQSRSVLGVVRGLHFRTDGFEAKLVRSARGAVYDVAVDLRPSSPTFGRWEAFTLDDAAFTAVYLPAGLAHGFQAVTDTADVCYRIDAVHRPEAAAALAWNDPELAIPWPLPVSAMSERDRAAPRFAELRPSLSDWLGHLVTGPVPSGKSDQLL